MPEAPELIYFRDYIKSTSLHQQIEEVEVSNENILENCTRDDLKTHLEGSTFESCTNYGKYLFLHTGSERDLIMHFGMTGNPVYFKNEDERPEYSRAEFRFKNGYILSYNCLRLLGELDLTEDRQKYIESKDLGPDVTSDSFDFNIFKKLLHGRGGYIKSSLMDQSLMAGIGNECSDEILFQSGIHPKKEVKNLSGNEIQKIFDEIHHVIDEKAKAMHPENELPDSFLLKDREEGADCPTCEGEIKKIKIGGRNGYYCPDCQKK